ncbi:Metallo-dependent phosphatase-like protein [Russula dissimulans]|nr:Metallo-dependent phosphatase-like protein [Russula dissimulans]
MCDVVHDRISPDFMWSDPDDIENWGVSPRGAGWLFGGSVTREFNHVNSISLIARAHQFVQGYKYMFDEALATVWSAPNCCYRCGNIAVILTVRENGARSFTVYGPAEENERDVAQRRTRRAVRYSPVPMRVISRCSSSGFSSKRVALPYFVSIRTPHRFSIYFTQPYVGALFSAHGTVLLGGVGHANCFITSPLFEPWSRLERISNADSRGFGGI